MADMPRYHYEVWADFDDGDCELLQQACLRPRDRFWGVPAPKIDSAFDNLLVPQPSWSPSTTQQLRKLVAAPYLAPNDWTPRLDAYFASPLALCARRVSSAASRLLGTTKPSLRSPCLAADDYVHGLKNAVRMATLKWGSGHRIELSRWNP
ncbi:hypothetical protein, partial [Thiolapillus sp.]|uniref:hypothetical protein n=5 Tax=Thiolapillus sp. TaxID=2017437 RepID=UPI003AF9A332